MRTSPKRNGRLPMGKTPDEWSYGDLDAGFRNAALVLDETFVTPDVSHQTLETRSAMAYWQNGKVYLHTGAQSTAQTRPAIARWLNMMWTKCFHQRIHRRRIRQQDHRRGLHDYPGAVIEEGQCARDDADQPRGGDVYRTRAAGLSGPNENRLLQRRPHPRLDMFVISDNGPYDAQGDAPTSGHMVSLLYQPQAMRWRGVTVLTNTPPRSAQSSPGGLQGISITEPIIAKAARKLGLDQVAIRYINCPEGKAQYGPPVNGKLQHATSAFIKEALQRGAEQFNWQGKSGAEPQTNRHEGARGWRVAELLCRRHHRLRRTSGHHPEGRVRFQSGIGNLGTESVIDVHRAGCGGSRRPLGKVRCRVGTRRSIFRSRACPAAARRRTR
jgi:xanthine dehydrogenase molybdenum-binding subunit